MENIICENCENLSYSCCGKCKIVNYCSSQCQKKNWSIHKKFCNLLYNNTDFNNYASLLINFANNDDIFILSLQAYYNIPGVLLVNYDIFNNSIVNIMNSNLDDFGVDSDFKKQLIISVDDYKKKNDIDHKIIILLFNFSKNHKGTRYYLFSLPSPI